MMEEIKAKREKQRAQAAAKRKKEEEAAAAKRAQAAAKRKKEEEAAAREAADRPKVLGIVVAAFRSVIAEVDAKTSSAAKIRNLTRDRAVDNLASRKDLTWNGLYVYETARTMATTFKQSLPL